MLPSRTAGLRGRLPSASNVFQLLCKHFGGRALPFYRWIKPRISYLDDAMKAMAEELIKTELIPATARARERLVLEFGIPATEAQAYAEVAFQHTWKLTANDDE